MKSPYDEAYFSQISRWAARSASVVVPIVLESLVPGRVIDVGCGAGSWLAAFSQLAGSTIVGVDGSTLPASALAVASDLLVQCDLSRPLDLSAMPGFSQERRFDLAVSLEVVEHLPPHRGASFVHDLTQLAPAVLFSAAIPHQGGTNHINEQWQSHWASLFHAEGFLPRDVIRPRIWGDSRVSFWYQQNMILYTKSAIPGNGDPVPSFSRLDLVHPEVPLRVTTPSVGQLARSLSRAVRNTIRWRLYRRTWMITSVKKIIYKEHNIHAIKRVLDTVHCDYGQWARTVMYRECTKMVEQLNPRALEVLEISAGEFWRPFPFKSFSETKFPHFDICSATLDRTFDLIIADQVFEHLLWPYRAGRNVYSMLPPGGHFLVMTPFLIRVHEIPFDCSRWTELGMKHLLAECGFPMEGIRTGSWGNRACVKANFTRWAWRGWFRSLANEPNFPVVVWALAKK